jgi:hypothetical protein
MDNELNKATSQGITDTVQKALKNVQFPASKQDLVGLAQQNNVLILSWRSRAVCPVISTMDLRT